MSDKRVTAVTIHHDGTYLETMSLELNDGLEEITLGTRDLHSTTSMDSGLEQYRMEHEI